MSILRRTFFRSMALMGRVGLDEFKAEIMAFPNGRFDDQVDSLSQFLGWAEHRKRIRVGSGRHIGMY